MEVPPLVRRGDGGLSRGAVERARNRGLLVPVLPGTFLRPDLVTEPAWRAAAATAWNPRAVVVGRAAAQQTFWSSLDVTDVEVAAPSHVRRPGYRFVRREIPTEQVVNRGGIRMTRPALTALDLAATTGGDSIDRVLRSRLARIGDLDAALAVTPGRRGNRTRRRLLLDSRAEPWSAAERLAHRVLRSAGLTGWAANHPVRHDIWTYFLDVAFVPELLAIEIDGVAFHSGAVVFEEDRVRQNHLVRSGWTVLRYTWRRLVDDPSDVVAEIRAVRRRLARVPRRADPDAR